MQMQYRRDIRALISHSAGENAVLVAIVLLHLAVAIVLAHHFHFILGNSPIFSFVLFAASYMMIVGVPFLWLLARERPESPLAFVHQLFDRWKILERLVLGMPAILAMAVFLPTFGALKSAIPAMSPYHLDPTLSRMDLMLHGGAPWQLLQPVLGHPWVSFAINWLYHLWLGVFYAAFCFVAIWIEQLELRRRFLTAFVLCWALLGNLAATLLASVGPCFYGIFYRDDPYTGLMSYLHQADHVAPLAALKVQAELVVWAQSGMSGLGRGISAMPSMHVSITCLLTLMAWKLGPKWGMVATVFLIGILVGSVHLGYHYAVDGYASLIATPVIWWASKHVPALHQLRLPWSGQSAVQENRAKA